MFCSSREQVTKFNRKAFLLVGFLLFFSEEEEERRGERSRKTTNSFWALPKPGTICVSILTTTPWCRHNCNPCFTNQELWHWEVQKPAQSQITSKRWHSRASTILSAIYSINKQTKKRVFCPSLLWNLNRRPEKTWCITKSQLGWVFWNPTFLILYEMNDSFSSSPKKPFWALFAHFITKAMWPVKGYHMQRPWVVLLGATYLGWNENNNILIILEALSNIQYF